MTAAILYEDEFLTAYCKPALVHTVPGKTQGSFVDEIKTTPHKWNTSFYKEDPEAGLINRLDFETSGILLAAKNEDTFKMLREMTKKDEIQKNYIFLSDKTISQRTACELSIGARGRRQNKVKAVLEGRRKDRLMAARTLFDPFAQTEDGLFLLGATIFQGQRHQIRVHAKEIECPLINDSKYDGKILTEVPHQTFILHNFSVRFIHPKTNKETEITAPFSTELREYLKTKKWKISAKEIGKNTEALLISQLGCDG